MTRHPIDPLSLLFGVFFSGAGLWVLLTDADTRFVDERWTWPVLLLAAGLAMIASVVPSRRGVTTGDEPASDPDETLGSEP